MDGFRLMSVGFADDIIIASKSKRDLRRMLSEVITAFSKVGLEVSESKSHWSSYPSLPGTTLQIGSAAVSWEPNITFVGTVLNLSGNYRPAIEYRLAKATCALHKWAPLLLNPAVPRRRRLDLASRVLGSSALWLSETWTPTKAQQRRLDSWAARQLARVARCRREADEDMGQYWRRLHRKGHSFLQTYGGPFNKRRKVQLHRFAGHAARCQEGQLRDALRTRPLAWWRYQQRRHQSQRYGLHPKRFKAWRWEGQLTAVYGEAESEAAEANIGWLANAQYRDAWKHNEDNFAEQY